MSKYKPDYNPDKEKHVKHKFIVHKSTTGKSLESIGGMKFNDEGRFLLNDEGLAREIQTEMPTDVTVTRMRYPDAADRGHNYFFGRFSGVPWARYDELGRRLPDVDN